MGDDASSKRAKNHAAVLGKVGQGPPPGFQWNVAADWALHKEMTALLIHDVQREYMREQVQELARNKTPSHPVGLDVKSIEDFFELRDKAGLLCGLNVRLFFGIYTPKKYIILLGIIHKQNNGPTPEGDKLRMRRRWRSHYRSLSQVDTD